MLSLDSVSVDSSVAKLDSSSEDPGDALEYLPPDDLLHGGPLAGGTDRRGGSTKVRTLLSRWHLTSDM